MKPSAPKSKEQLEKEKKTDEQVKRLLTALFMRWKPTTKDRPNQCADLRKPRFVASSQYNGTEVNYAKRHFAERSDGEEMISEGKMPTREQFLEAMERIRTKYADRILQAREKDSHQ